MVLACAPMLDFFIGCKSVVNVITKPKMFEMGTIQCLFPLVSLGCRGKYNQMGENVYR